MSIYTILEGTHSAKPIKLGLFYSKRDFKWAVQFDKSVKYDIGHKQADINKLCGVRYLFGDYSARFGWRYDPKFPEMVEIMAYVHDNGKVTKNEDEVSITRIPIKEIASLHLYCNDAYYWFSCNGVTAKVPKTHNQKISFAQNVYFGGMETAPHDIKVMVKKGT